MKFGNKLFFLITSLLTIIFAVFGIWMLSAYFRQILNREVEQTKNESNFLQYVFEMSYQSTAEFGDLYAIDRAVESVRRSLEKEDNFIFVCKEDGVYIYGEQNVLNSKLEKSISGLCSQIKEKNTYSYGIRRLENDYLINVSMTETDSGILYLGNCKDIGTIFADRNALLRQYRIALCLLLFLGGLCIFGLSRIVTKPLRTLSRVASQIADGDLGRRSNYKKNDEIGELARSFNSMSDSLVDQMKEKELEAKRKDDFTAAFAHELKTPLTSIIGYADMLNTIDLTEEERREAYFYIYSQGKRLESLSYKLLELVNMEQNNLHFRQISLKELENNIKTTMRPIWEKKKIHGKVVMEKGELYGDYELLLSLFYNLLDNAVKAVDEGGFVLMKGIKHADGYEIKVVDNGRGIPEDEISRITEAFYMVDKSRSRKEGGAGIGMALCKKIIELHGAKLFIESKLSEGTVMKVIFTNTIINDRKELPDENKTN